MARSSAKKNLEQRAMRAMLTHAFFRWESAVTIALTILLTFFLPQPFPGWQPWFYLIGGVMAVAAIVYTSMTDPEFGRKVVAEMLHSQFDIGRLRYPRSREYLERALEYRERIQEAIIQQRSGLLRDNLQETARQIDEWLDNFYQLGLRLDLYHYNDVIKRDQEAVPKRLAKLRQELDREDDPQVRKQLAETLRSKELQWTNLEQLANNMQRAELQMENTLTAMGTIYSQLLLVGAKDVDSGRAQRLREEIGEEVNELQDVLDAMDQVYETSASL